MPKKNKPPAQPPAQRASRLGERASRPGGKKNKKKVTPPARKASRPGGKKTNKKHLGETSPLEHIFGSKTRVRILNLFFANSTESFYLREISRRIGIRLNSTRREVENLKKYGIIKGHKPKSASSKKFFVLNTDFPIYPELRALLLKGHLFLENDLTKAINKLGQVSLILLSGAFVDDNQAPTDILVVGRLRNEKLTHVVNKFEKKLGFEIKYTLMPKQEYKYRKLVGDRFLYSILESKQVVALDKMSKHRY